MIVTRQTCRICQNDSLKSVLSLGDQNLASYFETDKFPPIQRKIPLELVRCDTARNENACGLVQLKHTVPSDFMYSSYGYRSGINEAMVSHLQSLAQKLEEQFKPEPATLVVDIGANDGTLLKGYRSTKFNKVGFEPSNVAPADHELPENFRYIRSYFTAKNFQKHFSGAKAKIITSIAMFYDLENPNQFVSDIAQILDPEGCWVAELSYLPFMLDKNSFDTICHEHLEYYHLDPVEFLLKKHGLKVFDVETNAVNGGSFRVYVCHEGSRLAQRDTESYYRLMRFRQQEFELALDQDAIYEKFFKNVERVKKELKALLLDLKKQGKKIYGYGASTKGNVTLQYCEIDAECITAIAERNPSKVGTRTLGTRIPILSEEAVRKAEPDYLLILPWHFLDGFIEREKEFLNRGGKFIVPLPEVRIVEK